MKFLLVGNGLQCHFGPADDILPGAMSANNERMKKIFGSVRTIAVVGASPNPGRPSHGVMKYLLSQGFEVIPVRPKVAEILGQKCYPRLEDIPVPVELVDVFRRPEACPDVALSAVAIGAKVLWLQEGVISEEAADIASGGGLEVVMDRCTMKEHRKLAH